MEVHVIRLHLKSGLHAGRHGIGIEGSGHTLPADSIFAALVSQLALRDPALVDALVSAFPYAINEEVVENSPPFLITSAFPFAGDVLFYPTPLCTGTRQQVQASAAVEIDKSLKKVAFLSQSLFERVLGGEALTSIAKSVVKLQGGLVWISPEEVKTLPDMKRGSLKTQNLLWLTERRPRVAVDRTSNRSNIFYHRETFYREGCGLWFGVTLLQPKHTIGGHPVLDLLMLLLQDLEIHGIGQLRSYGLGEFTRDAEPRQITLPDATTETFVTLSRIAPAPADLPRISDVRAAYRVVQVGGFARSGQNTFAQRNTLLMLNEGSILPADTRLCGQIVDVDSGQLAHPVWRYGLAFPVGLVQA